MHAWPKQPDKACPEHEKLLVQPAHCSRHHSAIFTQVQSWHMSCMHGAEPCRAPASRLASYCMHPCQNLTTTRLRWQGHDDSRLRLHSVWSACSSQPDLSRLTGACLPPRKPWLCLMTSGTQLSQHAAATWHVCACASAGHCGTCLSLIQRSVRMQQLCWTWPPDLCLPSCLQVIMAPDCIGPEVEKMVNDLQPGQVLLLENVRFHKEEERNDDAFATKVSRQSCQESPC